MSDFQAIGGVSVSLRALLRDRMELPPGLPSPTVPVTVAPPPTPPEEGEGVEAARVNLFLYRVTRNGSLANQEIPGHGHPSAYGKPPLSLDLHFLLTAYGVSEIEEGVVDETTAHFLLGSAMRVLHDVPVITEDLLDVGGVPILHPSLHGEYEHVKISLDPLSLEDLAKVWTATTFPFRLSAAYTVSVVQIESLGRRRHPQPVGEPPPADPSAAGPQILVLPAVSPRIDEVRVRRGGGESRFAYARILDELVLLGSGLAGGPTRVWIGGVEVSGEIQSQQQGRLVVTVPDHSDLVPGAQTVSVSVGGSAFRSNLAAFVLVPRVDAPIVRDFVSVPRRFTVSGSRLWHPERTGETLIGEELVPRDAYLGAPLENQIVVPLPDTLPAWPVQALRSGLLGAVNVPDPTLAVAVDGGPAVSLTLDSTPADLPGAAGVLQRALRRESEPSLAGARVTATPNRLWVVPGELGHDLDFTGPAATSLELTPALASQVRSYLSGRLEPFPRVTSDEPRLRVTLDADTEVIELGARPTSTADAATLLGTAFQAGGLPPAFGQVEILVLGEQLLVATDAGNTVIESVPGVDETTAAELRFHLDHRVRVRVNGAEDVDQRRETLP